VVELELDPVTFQSVCRGIWLAVAPGSVWSRRAMTTVLQGEILRALGSSRLSGCAAAAEQTPPTVCCSRDLVPTAEEIPEIRIRLMEGQGGGMRGFEHLPHLGVPAAYAAAVCQATGLYVDQIPITEEVIQQCLET
jgi:CO/xanthine dehydrogenase Mo-binding subunit